MQCSACRQPIRSAVWSVTDLDGSTHRLCIVCWLSGWQFKIYDNRVSLWKGASHVSQEDGCDGDQRSG